MYKRQDKNGQLALRAAVEQENESIVIEIEDNGAGISHDTLKNIFDPFFTTKSTGEGTGLGLYVSYGIIQEHGGRIEVLSDVGKGAVFRLRFPLINIAEKGI